MSGISQVAHTSDKRITGVSISYGARIIPLLFLLFPSSSSRSFRLASVCSFFLISFAIRELSPFPSRPRERVPPFFSWLPSWSPEARRERKRSVLRAWWTRWRWIEDLWIQVLKIVACLFLRFSNLDALLIRNVTFVGSLKLEHPNGYSSLVKDRTIVLLSFLKFHKDIELRYFWKKNFCPKIKSRI